MLGRRHGAHALRHSAIAVPWAPSLRSSWRPAPASRPPMRRQFPRLGFPRNTARGTWEAGPEDRSPLPKPAFWSRTFQGPRRVARPRLRPAECPRLPCPLQPPRGFGSQAGGKTSSKGKPQWSCVDRHRACARRSASSERREAMPEKETLERAEQDKREGKSPSTQAGEFVREEMRHIREGKHGARSTKQAIAIGLSKARSAGVKLKPPRKGKASARTRRSAELALKRARSRKKPSPTRSRAIHAALRREGHSAASRSSLARQARSAARRRGARARSAAARKAVRTKGPRLRSIAARKAARTRVRRRA
jgi:uncharacterized protein DUF6496